MSNRMIFLWLSFLSLLHLPIAASDNDFDDVSIYEPSYAESCEGDESCEWLGCTEHFQDKTELWKHFETHIEKLRMSGELQENKYNQCKYGDCTQTMQSLDGYRSHFFRLHVSKNCIYCNKKVPLRQFAMVHVNHKCGEQSNKSISNNNNVMVTKTTSPTNLKTKPASLSSSPGLTLKFPNSAKKNNFQEQEVQIFKIPQITQEALKRKRPPNEDTRAQKKQRTSEQNQLTILDSEINDVMNNNTASTPQLLTPDDSNPELSFSSSFDDTANYSTLSQHSNAPYHNAPMHSYGPSYGAAWQTPLPSFSTLHQNLSCKCDSCMGFIPKQTSNNNYNNYFPIPANSPATPYYKCNINGCTDFVEAHLIDYHIKKMHRQTYHCKWLGCRSKPFKSKAELEDHLISHINNAE